MAIRGTILVADDEALARQSTVEALQEEGYQVYEAADGNAALKILEEVDEVEAGRFREDLYYRLNVIELRIPPLRERREDIPLLVEHLIRRHNQELKKVYKGVNNATMKLLMSLPWKGNVRELDNVLERATILGNGEWITPADLPRGEAQEKVSLMSFSDNLKEALQAYEKSHIEHVLKRLDGDKKSAAETLGVSLSSLYRKLEELDIHLGSQ